MNFCFSKAIKHISRTVLFPRKMKNSLQIHVFSFSFLVVVVLLLPLLSESQLTSSESNTLIELQKQLQNPHILQSWTNTTNFCNIPHSPSFSIICFNGHITELTVSGNITSKLSGEKLFTLLTKLPSLKSLSLTSLGISGSFSPKSISKFSPSLESLNLSSNFISGKIPQEISSLKNLRNLVLADNMFNGSVSDVFRGLSNLQGLYLGNNDLGPEVPSLPSNVITVSLKNNSFRSKIPEQIKKLSKLQSLDLSSNKFTGSIPEFLFWHSSLQTLSLDQNMLSGSLPNSSCSSSSKLRTLDVSHNLLTGKLPSCYSSKSFNKTVLFSFNCLSLIGTPNAKYQRPLSFCQNQASKAIAVEPVPKAKEKDSGNTKLGLVILIIIGVVILAAILVVFVLILLKRRRSRAEDDSFEVNNINNNTERHASDKVSVCSNTTTSSKSLADSRRVPQTMRSAVIGLPPYRIFSLEELEEATNDFDAASLFCEQLYKGYLREGIAVTVKCIKLKQKNLPQSLAQQMEVLSKLRHQHLVSVLGHYIASNQDHNQHTGNTIFIVQEYISNGSLRDFLTDCRKKEVLQWPQRMAIAIGVARGIQFLHMGVAPGIFGNNLEIENIMLDETLTVKISGYTIPLPSKVGAESLQAKTPRSNEDGEKEDVYQFGVILLQIITGKVLAAGSSEMGSLKLQLENGLRDEPSVLCSLADPSVKGSYAYESLKTTVEFALTCLCEDQSKRPSIEDVVWNLQYTIQVQQGWRTNSGNHESTMKAIYE